MPQAEVVDFIDLDDFSPGIFSDFRSGGGTQSAPDGAAQVEGTFGCYAAPGGGLIPMPRRTATREFEMEPGFLGSDQMPPGRGFVAILDIINFPGIRPPYWVETTLGTPDADPTLADYTGKSDLIMFVAQRYYDNSGSDWMRQWAVYLDEVFFDGGAAHEINGLDWDGDVVALTTPFQDYGFGSLDLGRASEAGLELEPGQPHFKIAVGGRLNIADDVYRSIYAFPGNAAYGPYEQIPDISTPFVISHQGRTIWTDIGTFMGLMPVGLDAIRGANYIVDDNAEGALQVAETLYWTLVNSLDVDNSDGTVFVEENPTGYGAWASMNANELLLIKQAGGAVLVRGSLNNPTVVRLPGVESTMGITSKAVVTPIGCVYGTRSGVWAWNGSDTAECLSRQLDGYFWEAPNTDLYHPAQIVGRFGYSHPFVFVPGNWVLDVRNRGWWRLDDPNDVVFSYYNHTIQGRVYATPATIDLPTTSDPIIPYLYEYTLNEATSHWEWVSQPLARTRNRRIDFREIDITVQGVGTVVVELHGLDGADVDCTFTFDSPNQPISLSESIKMSSHDLVVRLVADGEDENSPAPRVYRVSLGHRPAQGITVTGSEAGT